MRTLFCRTEGFYGGVVTGGAYSAHRPDQVMLVEGADELPGPELIEFGPQRNAIRYWIDDTISRRPDCLATVAQLDGEQRDRLRARGIPFVVFDPTVELPADVPFVGATNWAGVDPPPGTWSSWATDGSR